MHSIYFISYLLSTEWNKQFLGDIDPYKRESDNLAILVIFLLFTHIMLQILFGVSKFKVLY